MIYKITGVKKTTLPTKAGGTWNKVEVKTAETGDEILELGYSHEKNVRDNIKEGDTVTGYIRNKPWTDKDGGTRFNKILEGITAEYVYRLLLAMNPNIESTVKVDDRDINNMPETGPDRETTQATTSANW